MIKKQEAEIVANEYVALEPHNQIKFREEVNRLLAIEESALQSQNAQVIIS